MHGSFLNAVEKIGLGELQHQKNRTLTLCNVLDMSLLDAARLCTFTNKSAFDEMSLSLEEASSVLEDVRPLNFDMSSALEDVRTLTFDMSSALEDASSVLEDLRPLTSFRRPFNKLTRSPMPPPPTVVFKYIRLTNKIHGDGS